MTKYRVYVATNLDRGSWVESIVVPALEVRGCEVVSTWSKLPFVDEAKLAEEEAARLRAINLRDLSRADACLVISTDRGGEHHVEAGLAHHNGLQLVWTGRLILLARQPGVVRCATVVEAIDAVGELATRRARPSWMPAAPARTGT